MNFPKVELHLHLDGAIRYQTLLDLAIEKNIDLHGAKTAHELSDMLMTREPANLVKVLEAFYVFMPCILGDPDGLERIAYELCEDQAKDNVVYFEARYSPHFLCNTEEAESQMWRLPPYRGKGRVNPAAVVQAISKGFERGEKDFGVKARSILCCIRGHPDWNHEILELGQFFRHFQLSE
uniref:adenosine deaminase n=1 Tax=Plectus sambesii TaxID=2011161 RepID=A0A914VFJ6_9BILA